MDRKSKFYVCNNCKNLVNTYQFSGKEPSCCNKTMENMDPVTDGGGKEKHLPRVEVKGNCVTVSLGEIYHPMTEDHNIAWIYLVTKFGEQRKLLIPGDEPTASFLLVEGDIPIAAYGYCNMHGLWKTIINK